MSFSELLDDHFDEKAKDIQLGMIGRIEIFDKTKMRADVQPLIKLKNALGEEVELPILADLPVMFYNGGGFYIRPAYERGDLVWLAFSTFDISNALNEYSRAASDKIFSIENAAVISGIAKNVYTAPTEFGTDDGLIIGHKDGNSFMKFEDDKITFKFAKGVEEIVFSKTGIETKQQIKAGLDVTWNNETVPTKASTHTHTSASPGSPTSPPTPGS